MPHNTALFLIGADAATRCSELVLARQWCVRVIESDNEDFAEKVSGWVFYYYYLTTQATSFLSVSDI